jgi:hypothetical protein
MPVCVNLQLYHQAEHPQPYKHHSTNVSYSTFKRKLMQVNESKRGQVCVIGHPFPQTCQSSHITHREGAASIIPLTLYFSTPFNKTIIKNPQLSWDIISDSQKHLQTQETRAVGQPAEKAPSVPAKALPTLPNLDSHNINLTSHHHLLPPASHLLFTILISLACSTVSQRAFESEARWRRCSIQSSTTRQMSELSSDNSFATVIPRAQAS